MLSSLIVFYLIVACLLFMKWFREGLDARAYSKAKYEQAEERRVFHIFILTCFLASLFWPLLAIKRVQARLRKYAVQTQKTKEQ